MKRFFTVLTCVLLFGLFSCESDREERRDTNNFLGNKSVNFSLNLNLPQYANLKDFPGTKLIIPDKANFIEGVYIEAASSSIFLVYELAEPNHPFGSCSIPTIETIKANKGRFAYTCGEEKIVYDALGNKIDGKEGFPLRRYNAVRSGSTLNISF